MKQVRIITKQGNITIKHMLSNEEALEEINSLLNTKKFIRLNDEDKGWMVIKSSQVLKVEEC